MIPTQSRSPVSGPLAALMQLKQAEQALKQGASPVTPSGQPTVAGQALQSAQAMTQPPQQLQPQMGIANPNLRPGIQQQAAMQAQAQQPVTQAQLQQRLQAMQGAESAGIAAGPQDVGMAEGGIVGFSGRDNDQYVRSPEEAEASAASGLTFKDIVNSITDFLRGKGTTYDPEAPAKIPVDAVPDYTKDLGTPIPKTSSMPSTSDPQQQQMLAMQKLIASLMAGGGGGKPTPGPDIASMLREAKAERAGILKRLEPSLAQRPVSPEQLALDKALEEGIATSRGRVDAKEQRFLESERAREAAGVPTPRQELANFLKNVGGTSTLARGFTQAGKEQSVIEAARRKEKQAAIDRERQYKDLMDDQREAIGQRDIAIKQGRLDRAKAEQDRIDANTRALASLEAQLRTPELSAMSHLLGIQMHEAGADRRAAEQNRVRGLAALMKGMQPAKAPPGMSVPDQLKLKEHVNAVFPSKGMPTPEALTYLAKVDNGAQLIRDIANGNIKPDSPQWKESVVPALIKARELYTREFLAQTKHGAPAAVPYSQALADAEE